MTITAPARLLLVLISLMLLVPVAGIRLQSRADLERFQNRTLVAWPAEGLLRHPARYFERANAWLADRAFPIIAATHLSNNLLYFGLGVSPKANITVGPDDFIFLNGNYAETAMDIVQGVCVQSVDGHRLDELRAALSELGRFGDRHGYPVDVILVPTIPTLYGDRLPRSIPPALRTACAARVRESSGLRSVAPPPGLHFLYPFAEMMAQRDDQAFFPIGNFHPDGLSVKLVRDAYLAAAGLPASTTERMTLGPAMSELLGYHGIDKELPVYQLVDPAVTTDDALASRLQDAVQRFYEIPSVPVYVYENPHPASPQTVLIISDSFGYNEGISFAAAFRRVVQLPASREHVAEVIENIVSRVPIDRLLILFNEGNFGRVSDIGHELGAVTSPAPSPP